MAVLDTLNAKVALAKGWTWHEEDFFLAPDFGNLPELRTHWLDPEEEPAMPPDWVGTLKGVAGLMGELNDHAKANDLYWVWGQNANRLVDGPRDAYYCAKHGVYKNAMYLKSFCSNKDRPGDCVGTAWLSVKGKESDG